MDLRGYPTTETCLAESRKSFLRGKASRSEESGVGRHHEQCHKQCHHKELWKVTNTNYGARLRDILHCLQGHLSGLQSLRLQSSHVLYPSSTKREQSSCPTPRAPQGKGAGQLGNPDTHLEMPHRVRSSKCHFHLYNYFTVKNISTWKNK